jgi:hypothetical protein
LSALALTRGQIIANGLDIAGRPDLTSQARLWLNLFLERLYFNEDFDWLVKSTTGIVVSDGTPVPSDYRASKAATIVQASTGSMTEIQVMANRADYENRKVSYGSSSGCAKYAYVNHDLRQFFYLPSPIAGYTMNLDYYYIPALPDYTDPAQDSLIPKWGLPFEILMDHIKARAMEFNDDARQDNAATAVNNSITQGKFNNQDKRAGSSRFPMGKRFRNRFR